MVLDFVRVWKLLTWNRDELVAVRNSGLTVGEGEGWGFSYVLSEGGLSRCFEGIRFVPVGYEVWMVGRDGNVMMMLLLLFLLLMLVNSFLHCCSCLI